jgi:hypothetical protein
MGPLGTHEPGLQTAQVFQDRPEHLLGQAGIALPVGMGKGSAHQMVRTTPIHPSGEKIQNRIRLTSAKPPMKG